jgi:hypothetical protein
MAERAQEKQKARPAHRNALRADLDRLRLLAAGRSFSPTKVVPYPIVGGGGFIARLLGVQRGSPLPRRSPRP